MPENFIKSFLGLKFIPFGCPQQPNVTPFQCPQQPNLLRFSVPNNQILLHFGVPDNCSMNISS